MLIAVIERRAFRVRESNRDLGIACLERHSNTGDRTARSRSTDKTVDLPVRLVPDFRAHGATAAFAIGNIIEMIRPNHAFGRSGRELLREAPRHMDVVIGSLHEAGT